MNSHFKEPSTEQDSTTPNVRMRLTKRGKAVIGLTLAGVLTGGIGAALANHEQQQAAGEKASGQTVTIEPGQGWYSVVDELQANPHDTNARNQTRDAVEVELEQANPDLTKPGYVLQPGDVVQVPISAAASSENKK